MYDVVNLLHTCTCMSSTCGFVSIYNIAKYSCGIQGCISQQIVEKMPPE